MNGFLIIYQITLPEERDADAFVEFMREKYLPAVHKGPTRVGQVTHLALLRGVSGTHQGTHAFLLHMGFSGLSTGEIRVDDEEVLRQFESFDAPMERLGAYSENASWESTPPVEIGIVQSIRAGRPPV